NLDGSVRSVPLSETHLAGDPEGYVLASISVDSIDQLFTRILGEANPSLAGLRFLYVFDDYPKYSPQVKRWIGGPLLERFSQASHLPPPGFLLTGSEAWDASGQKDYWQKNPGTFFDLEVMPLDRESCTQWLQDFDLPIAYIDCLMEESEGIPARVKPLVERPGALEKLVKEGAKAQDFPYPASAQQRRWLHAAAMADFVSEESLLLLLGKAEGRKALEWFAASAPIDLVTVSVMAGVAHIHMRSDFRDKVFNLCMEKVPARHREFLYKFDLHTRISEKVPLPEDRDSLRLLSPVQPFNPKILTTLFGRDE
ncbi:MAG: hypothetical protein KJT03_18080, partial [Verrucomicrobiae bacterium]|nr:hypothetical protein [Verrucomicrobiae bacterium]